MNAHLAQPLALPYPGYEAPKFRRKPGRPPKLTRKFIEHFTLLTLAGTWIGPSARVLGVCPESVEHWLAEGRRANAETPGRGGLKAEFFRSFMQALADNEVGLLARVGRSGDWRAAAWILERRHRTRWGVQGSEAALAAEDRALGLTTPPDPLDAIAAEAQRLDAEAALRESVRLATEEFIEALTSAGITADTETKEAPRSPGTANRSEARNETRP